VAGTQEGLIRGVFGVVQVAVGQDEHRYQIAAEHVEAVRKAIAEGYSLIAVVPRADGSIELGLPGATSKVQAIRIV
jgi:hypothetical protein